MVSQAAGRPTGSLAGVAPSVHVGVDLVGIEDQRAVVANVTDEVSVRIEPASTITCSCADTAETTPAATEAATSSFLAPPMHHLVYGALKSR